MTADTPPTPGGAPPGSPGEPVARRRRTRWWMTAVAVVVAASLATGLLLTFGGGLAGGDTEQEAAAADRPVTTDEVTRGDLQGTVTTTGTLRYAGSRTVRAGSAGTVTGLPATGSVLTNGDRLHALDDRPTYLLAGDLPAWRDFTSGMDDGPDVRQLEEDLKRLGHFKGEPDEDFRSSTTRAIKSWQKSTGQPRTGTLPLGSVLFAPSDLRVGAVSATPGDLVAPGGDLYETSSATQVVEADVRLGDQPLAVVGARVSVQLPGGTTVDGAITGVGAPKEVEGSNGLPQTVIPVTIGLDDPGPAADFQQASVTVAIPSDTREDVLIVPVSALTALTPDSFAVEVVAADGTTTKVQVQTGLFAGGRVEVSGDDLRAGQRVVVPQR